jgi:hypothetical protein
VLLAIALLCITERAIADGGVKCLATEIQATNEKKGVDPKLERLKAQLSKPPFSAFDTFKWLAESSVSTELNKPASQKLVNGGNLTLLLKDRIASEGKKVRLRLGVDVDNKDGKRIVSTVLSFDSGDTIFPVAGEPYQSGTYVLALTCHAP